MRNGVATILLSVSLWTAAASAASGPAVLSAEPSPTQACVTQQQRAEIGAAITENVLRLSAAGVVLKQSQAPPVRLTWPVQVAPSLSAPVLEAVGNYVDHDVLSPGSVLDFNCGTWTYDVDGYNHTGTDIGAWPFGFDMMDRDEARIVAAAGGTIVWRQDGYFDRNCSFDGSPPNGIAILHADSSAALYLHMKNGSVIDKEIGDVVEQGEILGVAGSSGFSSGPHLHFEVMDAEGSVVDPWAGPCNATTQESWWQDQPPYLESGINRVATHEDIPEFFACPETSEPHLRDSFAPGDEIYWFVYLRNQRAGEEASLRVFSPGGYLWFEDEFELENDYFESWMYWWETMAEDVPQGTWRVEFEYNGETLGHSYTVGSSCEKSGSTLCLAAERFEIEVQWRDFQGNTGSGRAVQLTDDTGYFWFFWPENSELFLKILDGTALTGRYWVFFGAITNVEYTVRVTDKITGTSKTYFNPAGTFASIADLSTFSEFPESSDSSFHRSSTSPWKHPISTPRLSESRFSGPAVEIMSSVQQPSPECSTGPKNLCLGDGRFQVEITWEDFDGNQGIGHAEALSSDSGYFWFFQNSNAEVVIKILDGTAFNQHFWLFHASLTNVAYTVEVRDRVTGTLKTYSNPLGTLASFGDVLAFPR